jgi:cytochrome b561
MSEEMPETQKYNKVAIILHWLIALALVAQIAMGFWMGDLPKDASGIRAQWFNFHKSVGIVLIALIVIRLVWRLMHRPPELPAVLSDKQKKLTHWGHWALYALMVVVPVSGALGSSFSQHPIKFFAFELPRLWDASQELKGFFSEMHEMAVFVFIAVVVGHIGAAILHAVARDGVMQRMSLRTPAQEE